MVSELELRRKAFHVVMGLFFMYLYYNNIIGPFFMLYLLIFGSIICFLSRSYKIPIIWQMLTMFDRPTTLASFPGKGAWFFVLGLFISMILFSKNITLAAMSVLVIGDAISHIIGVNFGKIKHPFSDEKFVEGHIVGAISSTIIASYFVPVEAAILGSFAGMFIEGVDIKLGTDPVDDNLLIPVSTGTVMAIVVYLI